MTMTTLQPWPRGSRLRARAWRGALSVRRREALPRRLSARGDQYWRRRRRHRLTAERLLAQITRCATTVVVRQTLRASGESSPARAAALPSLSPARAERRTWPAPQPPVAAPSGTRAPAPPVTRHRRLAPRSAANSAAAAPRAQAHVEVRAGVSHTHTRTIATARTHAIALRVEQRTRLLTRHNQSFVFARHTLTEHSRRAAFSGRLAGTAGAVSPAPAAHPAAAPAGVERAFRGTATTALAAPRERAHGTALRGAIESPRATPTIWRSPSSPDRAEMPAPLAPGASRGGTAAGDASPALTPARQARSPVSVASAAPRLDSAAMDRLAEDVMTRIERRLRIERERRGL